MQPYRQSRYGLNLVLNELNFVAKQFTDPKFGVDIIWLIVYGYAV